MITIDKLLEQEMKQAKALNEALKIVFRPKKETQTLGDILIEEMEEDLWQEN